MNKLKKTLKGFYIHIKYGKSISSLDKVIIIDLVENKFNRYLYPLFYMLHSNGYKPILRLKKNELTHMFYDVYQRLIFTNGLYYKLSKNMNIVKRIDLNPDYFRALDDINKRSVIIPMCMHPLIYANKIKPSKKNIVNRIIFFAGTVNETHHNKPQVFDGIITRYEIIKLLKDFKNSIFVEDKNVTESIYNSITNAHFVIYDSKSLKLKQDRLFKELSRSSFYLALPGRGMPLCHNVIEAMYCNCIPIIQDIYANMFPIPLEDNVNCLIYKDKSDFNNMTKYIDNLNLEKICEMKNNVEVYYNKKLSPKAITSLVLKSEQKEFYLQAEGRSIGLYKQL